MLLILLMVIVFVAVLAVGLWQVGPRFNRQRYDARPGSTWLHDPQGNLIEEDEEFKRPDDEGDLL